MKKHKQHGNHERWMVSYADFMTLLFAFFVVLYSSSQVDRKKMAQLSSAITAGFRQLGVGSSIGGAPVVIPGTTPPPAARTNVVQENEESIRAKLESGLADELRRHIVSLRETPEGLVLSLREVGFFDSGSATMRANSMEMFDRIGSLLGGIRSNLRIEGHTDNMPIHNSQFLSNWELSTARATEVIRILLTREGIAPDRLSAAGYGEFHPIADNATDEGRRLNRRVDIVILAPRGSPTGTSPSPAAAPQISPAPAAAQR
jgi:chemotaxis protein MotB